MLTSKTRAWHRVMPAISYCRIILCAGPCEGDRTAMCCLCPLESHHLPRGETCLYVSMLLALGTDLDTGPENASFAASQACAEAWLGDLG